MENKDLEDFLTKEEIKIAKQMMPRLIPIVMLYSEYERLKKADKIHDIRRYNGNIDKDYIRDDKDKKIYLTYEDYKEKGDR